VELEGWFRRGIAHIFQIVPVTAWAEGTPSEATTPLVIAEHPIQPMIDLLPDSVEKAKLLQSLMRDGWDTPWALMSSRAATALETYIEAPEPRASLIKAVKHMPLPPLPDTSLPMAGFLARLLNLSGERGTVMCFHS
jgi:hypothetical protein